MYYLVTTESGKQVTVSVTGQTQAQIDAEISARYPNYLSRVEMTESEFATWNSMNNSMNNSIIN